MCGGGWRNNGRHGRYTSLPVGGRGSKFIIFDGESRACLGCNGSYTSLTARGKTNNLSYNSLKHLKANDNIYIFWVEKE